MFFHAKRSRQINFKPKRLPDQLIVIFTIALKSTLNEEAVTAVLYIFCEACPRPG